MNYPRKVYAIRHNVTNRVYIGSSCRVDRRFQQHISAVRCHRHPVEDMQADFDQHGDNFTLTVLDHIATSEDLYKEYDWMHKNRSYIRGVGYNYKDNKWQGVDRDVVVKREEEKPSFDFAIKKMDDIYKTINDYAKSKEEAFFLKFIAASGFLCAVIHCNKQNGNVDG